MTEAFKARLRGKCTPGNHPGLVDPDPESPDDGCRKCSTVHVEEFKDCVGVVKGQIDNNDVPPEDPTWDPKKLWPEIDVYWEPSHLKYGYAEDDLEPA